MYLNTAATIRHDLNVFAEEAVHADEYFIAQKILPVYESNVKSGTYPKIRMTGGELMKKEATKRGPTGTYNEVSRKIETDTFDTIDRGLEERIDDSVVNDMSRFFDVEVLTTKLVTRAIMLDYEVRVAAKVMDSSVFTTTNGSVAYSEANLATIDFVLDLFAAKERLTSKGVIPNTMVMSDTMFNRLRRTTKLQTFLYGTLGSGTGYRLVNAQDIGNALGIPNVIIAAASYDTADKGQTASMSRIWGNAYIFVGYVASGDFNAMGIGRTIVWTNDSPGLFVTESYRDEKRRGDMIRVRHHTAEKIIDATAAELIATQVTS
jgi:hypothetical protein